MLESLFNKAAGLKRLQHRSSPVKFEKFLIFFNRRVPVAAPEVNLIFSKEFGATAGPTVSNKYQIQLKKSICCCENSEAATAGFL